MPKSSEESQIFHEQEGTEEKSKYGEPSQV